jgi:hypothetical protein
MQRRLSQLQFLRATSEPLGEEPGSKLVRATGVLSVLLSAGVLSSLVVRGVDLNVVNMSTIALGFVAGVVGALTSRALPAGLLMAAATLPTVFGWYVFLYLPFLLLFLLGGIMRARTARA